MQIIDPVGGGSLSTVLTDATLLGDGNETPLGVHLATDSGNKLVVKETGLYANGGTSDLTLDDVQALIESEYTGNSMSGTDIKEKLELLESDARLDASAIKNILANVEISNYTEGSQLVASLTGLNFLDLNINYARLVGKSCYAIGDSFFAENYFIESVCLALGINLNKFGYAGYTVTDGYGLGSLRTKIDDAINSNSSIIIFEGGSNDWYYGAPLGDINDTIFTTYYGSLNYIANKIVSSGKVLSVIVINLQQRNTAKSDGGSAGRVNFNNQEQYANAMIEVFKKYGIRVCDAFHYLGVTYENSSLYTSDGCHPNSAGSILWRNFLLNFILYKLVVPFDSHISLPVNENFIVKSGLELSLDANILASYNGGNTWNDISGNGRHGTIHNNVTPGIDTRKYLQFNGVDSYVDGLISDFSEYTLGGWVKLESHKQGGAFISTNGICSDGNPIFIQDNGTTFQFTNASSNVQPLILNEWNYVVGVQSGDIQTIYINGILVAIGNPTTSLLGSMYFIGKRNYGNVFLNCKVSQIHLYSRALSDSEILQNYNLTK